MYVWGSQESVFDRMPDDGSDWRSEGRGKEGYTYHVLSRNGNDIIEGLEGHNGLLEVSQEGLQNL